ncbi:hypothetical protein [Roseomonas chloroacetimidivorans]
MTDVPVNGTDRPLSTREAQRRSWRSVSLLHKYRRAGQRYEDGARAQRR